jgi:hypothetical protein
MRWAYHRAPSKGKDSPPGAHLTGYDTDISYQPPLHSCPPRGASLAATAVYQPRRPEKTVVYRVVQQHLETWLAQVRAAEPDRQ